MCGILHEKLPAQNWERDNQYVKEWGVAPTPLVWQTQTRDGNDTQIEKVGHRYTRRYPHLRAETGGACLLTFEPSISARRSSTSACFCETCGSSATNIEPLQSNAGTFVGCSATTAAFSQSLFAEISDLLVDLQPASLWVLSERIAGSDDGKDSGDGADDGGADGDGGGNGDDEGSMNSVPSNGDGSVRPLADASDGDD